MTFLSERNKDYQDQAVKGPFLKTPNVGSGSKLQKKKNSILKISKFGLIKVFLCSSKYQTFYCIYSVTKEDLLVLKRKI